MPQLYHRLRRSGALELKITCAKQGQRPGSGVTDMFDVQMQRRGA